MAQKLYSTSMNMAEGTPTEADTFKPDPMSNKRLNSTPADGSYLSMQPPKKARMSSEANSTSNKLAALKSSKPARRVQGKVFTPTVNRDIRFELNANVNDPFICPGGQQQIQVAPGGDYFWDFGTNSMKLKYQSSK